MAEVLEILADVLETLLSYEKVAEFDLNDNKEKAEFENFVRSLADRGYEILSNLRKDGSWGYSEITLYENTTTHSPSVDEPTYYLIVEGANDTGDWSAAVYAIW